jgi:hypothetical protein
VYSRTGLDWMDQFATISATPKKRLRHQEKFWDSLLSNWMNAKGPVFALHHGEPSRLDMMPSQRGERGRSRFNLLRPAPS